jgi:hypothetical protein
MHQNHTSMQNDQNALTYQVAPGRDITEGLGFYPLGGREKWVEGIGCEF